MSAATRLCIVAMIAGFVVAAIGFGQRPTAPFDAPLSWSTSR